MSESQLRVLSFNCWGLKFLSKNRNERIAGIAARLAQSDYDLIALQELWVYADYEQVKESLLGRLPFAKFFYSGALGAGLAIFSRFPIIESFVHSYSLNGAPIDVAAGDWFVGKAAASIVIEHAVLGQVQIFNTHLFAKGGEDGPEYNRAHRLVNAWEFAKLARQAAEMGRYVIAMGDFNSIPTTLPMTIIRDYAALRDCWSVTHPNAALPAPASNPPHIEAIRSFGITADSPLNTYSSGKPLDPHARQHHGKRLDYILYCQPRKALFSGHQRLPVLKCTECKVVLTEKVPGYDFSFSDHFGLEATLGFPIPEDDELYTTEGDGSGNRPRSSLTLSQKVPTLSSASVSTTIQALTTCYRFSRHRSSKELAIFCICILILFALVIGSAWLPHSWISSIFLLFTIFISWLATTLLYEGFLYGQWELNALMNVIEDLEIYKKVAETQSEIPRW